MRPFIPSSPSPSSRTPALRDALAGGATLVLLGGLVTAVPGAPALAAPPVTVERQGIGRTTTVTLGERQLRPADGAAARAAGARARTLPLDTAPFAMVALTWRGPDPGAQVRTRRDDVWGPWHDLAPLGDGPTGAAEGRGGPAAASQPLWVGDADGAQVRTERRHPRALRLVLIDPGEDPGSAGAGAAVASPAAYVPTRTSTTRTAATRTAGSARTAATLRTAATADSAPRPRLWTRGAWGADNSLRNGKPVYLPRLKQVHVHHTATGNRYSRAEVPAIIRGIYRYHTVTLGWFDIGYNFLVDRFGRAWIGRSGGFWRRVRGAHTRGFNHDSTGIAVIGTNRRWEETRKKIIKLAAYKLDREGRDADRRVRVRSKGSDRYPSGTVVRLPAIDGHRDTNQTACPGKWLYNVLDTDRRRTQRRIDRF